jgi:TRAP-type C4-dicarboxylate transport system permease large subunit
VLVAARGSALPLVIPVIIMGGILTGWFTPTEAGMAAAVYILVVLIPALNRGHVRELPRDFMYAGLLYSLPLAAVAGASAFGWMVAYLRGPDIVAGYITSLAGTNGTMIMFLLVCVFVIVGDFIDAVPAIIIFMPIINKLTEVGNINPLHMGAGHHHDAGVRPHHAAVRAVAARRVEVRRHRLRQAVIRSLPLYAVFFATIAFVVAFPDIVLWLPKQFLPESVGCFKSPTGAGFICP